MKKARYFQTLLYSSVYNQFYTQTQTHTIFSDVSFIVVRCDLCDYVLCRWLNVSKKKGQQILWRQENAARDKMLKTPNRMMKQRCYPQTKQGLFVLNHIYQTFFYCLMLRFKVTTLLKEITSIQSESHLLSKRDWPIHLDLLCRSTCFPLCALYYTTL